VLAEYAKTFAFHDIAVVEALRAFLQGFQLPGVYFSKEPYIFSKEPYVFWKEPFVFSKET